MMPLCDRAGRVMRKLRRLADRSVGVLRGPVKLRDEPRDLSGIEPKPRAEALDRRACERALAAQDLRKRRMIDAQVPRKRAK